MQSRNRNVAYSSSSFDAKVEYSDSAVIAKMLGHCTSVNF